MFLTFREQVKSIIDTALRSYEINIDEYDFIPSQHADISSNLSFKLSSILKKNPNEIASSIVDRCTIPNDSYVEKIECEGPYINAFVSKKYLNDTISSIKDNSNSFGGGFFNGRIVLEHTSANPNGPLHVGHIRNSIIGDTLKRILVHAGYDVTTHYYVNDMGRQIAIVSWGLSRFELDHSKKSDHAIADIYIKANSEIEADLEKRKEIDELMQSVEKGDIRTINEFDTAVDHAIKGITETLSLMNIWHDEYVKEALFVRSGSVNDIVSKIKDCGKTFTENGALILNLEEFGFDKNLVIQRSDGTSLYTTRDLAYHSWKGKDSDRMIDVLGADHKLISSQLQRTLKLIKEPEPEIIIFEFVSLPEGSMSTRKGKFITADDLIEKVQEQAYKEVEKRRPNMSKEFKNNVSRMVSIAAIRYDIVKVSPEKSTVFDWKSSLDFEKQGGPYVQYSYARACNILKKARNEGFLIHSGNLDPSLIVEDSEIELIKKMSMLDYYIEKSSIELKPNIIAIYAREIADAFNQFYRFVPVIAEENEQIRINRIMLVDSAKTVLFISLEMLGIEAPESM